MSTKRQEMNKISSISYNAIGGTISVIFENSSEEFSPLEFNSESRTGIALREIEEMLDDAVTHFNNNREDNYASEEETTYEEDLAGAIRVEYEGFIITDDLKHELLVQRLDDGMVRWMVLEFDIPFVDKIHLISNKSKMPTCCNSNLGIRDTIAEAWKAAHKAYKEMII